MTEAFAFAGALALLVVIDQLGHRGSPSVPPRPEWMREQFAKKPIGGSLGYVLLAMFFLPFVVPAVLLIALSDGNLGRAIGFGLAGRAVGGLGVSVWRGRPEHRRREQDRQLAISEAFWSRPDADEHAARMRKKLF